VYNGLHHRHDVKHMGVAEARDVCFNGVIPDVDNGFPAAFAYAFVLICCDVELEHLRQVQSQALAFVDAVETLRAKIEQVVYVVEVNANTLDDANDGARVYLLHVQVGAGVDSV